MVKYNEIRNDGDRIDKKTKKKSEISRIQRNLLRTYKHLKDQVMQMSKSNYENTQILQQS